MKDGESEWETDEHGSGGQTNGLESDSEAQTHELSRQSSKAHKSV